MALHRRRRPRRVRAAARAVELPYGRKRALEIATTLALDPEMLLLDEPTAGHGTRGHRPHLGADQVGRGEPHGADGRAQSAASSPISRDRITVLTRGRVLAEGDYADGVEQSRGARGLYGSRAMPDRRRPRRCRESTTCTPGTASRTCCTA